MATIDDKVVAMSFESSKFEQGVNKTITALDKLKAALHFPNAGKGLTDINSAAKNVQLGHIGKAVDEIKGKLGLLSVAALAVFAQMAQKAVAAGTRFVKAFTLDPLKAGFSEYTTNLNAVQTILANTQASGAKLKDVNAALKELNEYSDKTIYNFGQMAKNIGTFTAAGVDLKTATGAIKGIANLAALSGSNAEQASTAMYQLSQAISSGRVSLQDWNSVVNAGMGGTVFQRALAQTAQAMGKLDEGSVKLKGSMKNVSIEGESFRQSIQAGPGKTSWLTSDVLTNTLKQFTGDLTAAELKAQGFNAAQIAAIQQTAITAKKAATEVKTLQGVLDTAKETAGSGWAATWQIIFGDFGEAKRTFTDLSNTINDFINKSADARNKVLGDWKALGGRTVLIEGIKNAFHALGQVIAPIKDAFRDIFPAVTGKQLYDLTVRFKEFTETLTPSRETVENLRRTFRGLFALLDIGKQIIGGIFTVFGQLFGAVSDGSGSFLNFTGNIGDFLVSVDEALKKGDRLHNFFEGLGRILAAPVRMLAALRDALLNLFGGFSSGGFSGEINGMTAAMTPFQRIMEGVGRAWARFLDSFSNAEDTLRPVIEAIVELFQGLGPALSDAISNMNFEAILQVIRTGLFAGIFLMFKKFLGKGSFMDQIGKGFAGGILANISGSFKALEGSMVAMQQNIKAKTLKEIAIAIALLTASVVALSFVDPERLKSALTAMTVAFGQLLGAMAILGNITKSVGFIKMPIIAASMILLAGAITTLSIAVVILSRLSWEQLAKGLGAVAVLLGVIAVAVVPLSSGSAGMVRAGVGISAIAVGLNLLAIAVTIFSKMNLGELGKGLGAVAIGLGLIAAAARVMPTGMIAMGAGLIAIAVGLRILANVVEKLGGMDWRTIGKGMAGIGIGLVIIAGAMRLMPKNMVLTAAGLLLVAVALQGIAKAVTTMGGMSIRELATGLIGLAASLVILAGALYLMSGTLAGAAALGIAAAGIALLAPALVALGKQSWGEILKGLITLAAALTILGVAGLLITPVIPSLLGLGAALLLIGAGLALAGAGIALIGVGLSALVVAAPTGFGVLLAAIVEFQQGLIKTVKNLVLGLLEIVKVLAATAPQFVDALVKILNSLLDVVIKASPKMAEAFTALLTAILTVLRNNQGKIIQAGFDLLVALLKGIRNNIGQVVKIVADIIVKFLNSISSNLGRIIAAGAGILVAVLKGIASGYANVVKAALSIITKFIDAIANNLGRVATAGLSILTKFLAAIANGLTNVIKAGVNVVVAFITGVGNAGPRIVSAATNAIIKFINAISKNSVKLADAGAQAIINFLNGVARIIEQRAPEMRAAGVRIGVAIADGMSFGLASKAGELASKATSVAGGVLSAIKKKVKSRSPSEASYEIGQNVILGFANGLADNGKAVTAAESTANGVIDAFTTLFQITSPSKVMDKIGRDVMAGFAQGIRKGTMEDVNQAVNDMNIKLTDALKGVRATIAAEQAKIRAEQADIREERGKKKKERDLADIRESNKAIAESKEVIKDSRVELAKLTAGRRELTTALGDEKREMALNINEHKRLTDQLDIEQAKLDDLIKTREDARRSYQEQYSELPDVTPEDLEGKPVADALGAYKQALATQIEAVTTYAGTLQRLRELGLDDETYKKLLEEGPAAQAFASQLLEMGRPAVTQLSQLSGQLETQAGLLAAKATSELYDVGVKSQQGLVDGLTKDLKKVETAMERIAATMVAALKKKLKIKSPSEVFAELGKFSMEGMAQGFRDSTKVLTDAVEQVAEDAMTTMQAAMQDMSNVNPVITPILDLTQARALMNTIPITAAASYGQASAISADQARVLAEQAGVALGGPSFKFEQNNYSPEALSDIEIYRQTKNQLSQIKSVLSIA